ncbi:TerB N-terminal domain-containing protein [Halomonas sp. hl-4]|uniref:tellurite resistance TerB family protein n=1 Tax=Halomonas sp. hl-4 TaxID=1761789 RepID=UPI000BB74D49|nr:TerB N-terminal domain-containing protein [Halomonas sp. hl-4]SNY95816.1 Tellurite resistance protein TerB [Halomonas sp. hl-4]
MEVIIVLGILVFTGMLLSAFRKRRTSKQPSASPHTPPKASYDTKQHRRTGSHPHNRDVRGPSHFDDDDGLATFTISIGQPEEKSRNKNPGRWVAPGESIKIDDYSINGGNFYFGGRLSSTNQFGSEASLIDETLKVENVSYRELDSSLGYWPKYSVLSPKCRGAYLHWLSSQRADPDTPVGYVFLYFYGLERRITVDSVECGEVSDEVFTNIATEIRRLLTVYGKNPAFNSYAFRLLEWMQLLRPKLISISNDEIAQHNLRVLFSINAGKLVETGQPIPAEMAYVWLKFTDFVPRTPARRCPEEFKNLFCKLYTTQHANGLKIKPNKTFVKPAYHPASGSLSPVTIDGGGVPDPTVLKSVANKIIELADQASEMLNSYSRYLGKEGNSRDDIEAVLLLPEEIADSSGSPLMSTFSDWAEKIIEDTKGLVSFQDFWSQLSDTQVEKVNKKEVEVLQGILDRTGFGMAPDPRFHHAKPSPTGNVVLFPGGHKDLNEPSHTFNEVGMALRLGAMVAKIDDHVHEAEVNVLENLINDNQDLTEPAKASLRAYLTWRLNSPQNSASLKKQIENLSADGKHGISKILVSVALADGKISPDEIKQMEKLYTNLGLDKSLVSSDIHGLTTSKASENPQDAGSSKSVGTAGFQLDESVLALHESETKHVQTILSSIFAESDEEESLIDESMPNDEGLLDEEEDDGLDPEHRKLLERLITREKWSRTDVESMCNGLGLMVDGAVETINNWSFELLDEAVLEDDGDIYVMLDVAENIAQTAKE